MVINGLSKEIYTQLPHIKPICKHVDKIDSIPKLTLLSDGILRNKTLAPNHTDQYSTNGIIIGIFLHMIMVQRDIN